MRNWNSSNSLTLVLINSVLSLPMRNWNRLFSLPGIACSQFWVYLWGIETPRSRTGLFLRILFWVYLWGIETRKNMKLMLSLKMFWVYLWGIETNTTRRNDNKKRSRFESTYEELKLMIFLSGRKNQCWSFESTYEELKHQSRYFCKGLFALFWVYLWGIETSSGVKVSAFLGKFWVYLWGIETILDDAQIADFTAFWVYLWGIETPRQTAKRRWK